MQISRPTPRRPQESVIPMINVVFLLLVFFLISARLAPPLPAEVDVPVAEGDPLEGNPDTVVLDAAGVLYYLDATDDAALEALRAREATEVPLTLRADQTLSAKALAGQLSAVSQATQAPVLLVVGG